jgi:hypothetical protein
MKKTVRHRRIIVDIDVSGSSEAMADAVAEPFSILLVEELKRRAANLAEKHGLRIDCSVVRQRFEEEEWREWKFV